MNIGLVGYGKWGKNLARNLYEMGCLGSIADIDFDARGCAQRKYPNMLVVGEYERILEDDTIDGVVVSTNVPSHFTIAKAALEAGKDVFVEKPLATSVPECKELLALAAGGDCVLMAGHILLFSGAVGELREMVPKLGKMLYIHAQRMVFDLPSIDTDVLWDLAVHEVSVLIWIMGEIPVKVKAYGYDYLSNGKKDFVSMKIGFSGDYVAHVDVSWMFPKKTRQFVLVGNRGMVLWDDLQGEFKLKFYKKYIDQYGVLCEGNTMHIDVPMGEPLRTELVHFVGCCERREEPLTGGKHALAVTMVLAAAERSMTHQDWQMV